MDVKCKKKQSTASIVLGVVGVVFSVLIPGVTYACSIPGLVVGASHKRRIGGNTGMVLNIVALAIALVNSVTAVVMASHLSLFESEKK